MNHPNTSILQEEMHFQGEDKYKLSFVFYRRDTLDATAVRSQ